MIHPSRLVLRLVPLAASAGLSALAVAAPSSPAAASTPAASLAEAGVAWEFESLESTLAGAKAAQKPVLIYFWANGSESCSKMYTETLAKDTVVSAMSEFACFSGDTASTIGYELFQKYNMTTIPAFVFVDHEGRVDDAVVGTIDAQGLLDELARIREGRDTVRAFRERAAAAPEDFDVQYALAVKLQDCGDLEGHDAVTAAICEADPKGAHLVAARLHMAKLQNSIVEAATEAAGEGGEIDFESLDLAPVAKLAKKQKHAEVAFGAWNWIAAVESMREDYGASRKARMAAWSHATDSDVRPFSYSVAQEFWEQRDELDRKEKKFFLKVAARAVELFDQGEEKAAEGEAGGEAEGCGAACGDDQACGGCAEASARQVAYRASANDALACALYLNGKRSSAVEQLRAAIELAPENEAYGERLAMFEAGE